MCLLFPLNMSPRFILIVFCVPQTRPLRGSPIQKPGEPWMGEAGTSPGLQTELPLAAVGSAQASGTWAAVRSLLGDQAQETELRLLQPWFFEEQQPRLCSRRRARRGVEEGGAVSDACGQTAVRSENPTRSAKARCEVPHLLDHRGRAALSLLRP